MKQGSRTKIGIVDYGLGNLFGVQRALTAVGGQGTISKDPAELLDADKLILPGVGAFGAGMANLKTNDLVGVLSEFRQSGRPILGICLGMQLLLTESEENGIHQGLDFIPGKVVKFSSAKEGLEQVKIPQVSWNGIEPPADEPDKWAGTPLDGLTVGDCFYFVHSYYVDVQQPADCLAETQYGVNRFCSVVKRDNVIGYQFHPELSAASGLGLLKNFVEARCE